MQLECHFLHTSKTDGDEGCECRTSIENQMAKGSTMSEHQGIFSGKRCHDKSVVEKVYVK